MTEKFPAIERCITAWANDPLQNPAIAIQAHAELADLDQRIAQEREVLFKAQCWMCAQDCYVYVSNEDQRWHHKDGSVCGADRIRSAALRESERIANLQAAVGKK
jgi:hypothetical protein